MQRLHSQRAERIQAKKTLLKPCCNNCSFTVYHWGWTVLVQGPSLSLSCPLNRASAITRFEQSHVNTVPDADSTLQFLEQEILTTPLFLMHYWNRLFLSATRA